MTEARKYTRQEVARFKAIAAKKSGAPKAETPKVEGEVVKTKTFALANMGPTDVMTSFTETSRGIGSNGRPFTTVKGVEFSFEGQPFTRTAMAYGDASVEINKLIDGGATMLEMQIEPNRNTVKITGLVIDGTFVEFPDDRQVEGTEDRLAA